MTVRHLPASFKPYFWDVDFESLTLKNGRSLILKRILDHGDTAAILWMRKNYSMEEVKKLLLFTRDISQKSANFWADILDINYQLLPCLQKPYSRIQFGLSS